MCKRIALLTIITSVFLAACSSNKSPETMKMLETDQLIAWCIVPFDAKDRTPIERAEMLRELGMLKKEI